MKRGLCGAPCERRKDHGDIADFEKYCMNIDFFRGINSGYDCGSSILMHRDEKNCHRDFLNDMADMVKLPPV